MLAHWNPERETILEADCSGFALGGCLSQLDQQGRVRPIAYYSRRLNSTEVNYPIHDKEMLSIVTCLKEWQAELRSVGKPFTILSDHKNLSFFTSKRLLNERQVRYNDVLCQFNYILKWRSGRTSDRPDALSRRDQDKPTEFNDERTSGRVIQLLPSINTSPVVLFNDLDNNNNKDDPAATAQLFDDAQLQRLWRKAVNSDPDWIKLEMQ